MKKYIFETTATMKEYNNKKWWIDSGIVPRFTIAAANAREALELYRSFQRMYEEGKMTYEKMCGPLTHMNYAEGAYKWLDDPWPWEYAKNREV